MYICVYVSVSSIITREVFFVILYTDKYSCAANSVFGPKKKHCTKMEWQFFTSASKLPSLNFPETSLRTSKSDSGFWIILSAIQSNFLTLEVSIGRNPTPRPPVWGDPSGNQEARSGPGSSSVLHLPQYPDGAPWK